jgi:hypothetical protein
MYTCACPVTGPYPDLVSTGNVIIIQFNLYLFYYTTSTSEVMWLQIIGLLNNETGYI